jgi:hypothetical protein
MSAECQQIGRDDTGGMMDVEAAVDLLKQFKQDLEILEQYSASPTLATAFRRSPYRGRMARLPRLKSLRCSPTTGDSLESSKYHPPIPSSKGEAASSTEVAAPWGTVFCNSTGVTRPPVCCCNPAAMAPGLSELA